MEDSHLKSEDETAFDPHFDPFAFTPDPLPDETDAPQTASEVPTVSEGLPSAGLPSAGLSAPDYSEPQHRIQLSDQLHVDIPEEMLSDARAHLQKNGFPGISQVDTIAALLRSGAVTQGVPIEGGNAFYREHGVIPNAQAAEALRDYFQGLPHASASASTSASATTGNPSPDSSTTPDSFHSRMDELKDQHHVDQDFAPNPVGLMQVLSGSAKPDTKSVPEPETGQDQRDTGPEKDAPEKPDPQQDDKNKPAAPAAAGGRGGFPSLHLPSFSLADFIKTRAVRNAAADTANTSLNMAMESAKKSLQNLDFYLPSTGIPESDRALVYADRLEKDPNAREAHEQTVKSFHRLQETAEQWTKAAKENPVLQKDADKKLKEVDNLLRSGETVPDKTFKESLEKISKAISEMFSRIFQKLGLGKSAEAGMS